MNVRNYKGADGDNDCVLVKAAITRRRPTKIQDSRRKCCLHIFHVSGVKYQGDLVGNKIHRRNHEGEGNYSNWGKIMEESNSVI